MAKTKTVRKAKVVLTKAMSYKLAGRTFKKNVPATVKGDAVVEEFINNGRFVVRELEPVKVKKKKKKSSDKSTKKTSKTSKKKKKKKKKLT